MTEIPTDKAMELIDRVLEEYYWAMGSRGVPIYDVLTELLARLGRLQAVARKAEALGGTFIEYTGQPPTWSHSRLQVALDALLPGDLDE